MALTKANAASVLPATGGRALRTIDHGGGTYSVNYVATDNAGVTHEAAFANTAVVTWLSAALASPGSVPAVDTIKASYQLAGGTLSPATLAAARGVLFAYADLVGLGFEEA